MSRTYINGHLYVPFRVVESRTEKIGSPNNKSAKRSVRRYRTLVLRSDGVVCSFGYLPAPRGTPRQDRVLALSDGTLLSRAPIVDEATSTFSPAAITRFREAKVAGRSAMTLTPYDLLEGVHEHLKGSAVLAYEEDYALLTFIVVTSYAQAIFDAVPLVQIVGRGGLELGRALTRLGCNASLITGHTSATTATRILGRLGGLAVIDDLERLDQRGSEAEFGEFIRQLSGSTRKASAGTTWTNPRTMRAEELDLYGVKVVIDHSGTNRFLSSPLLKVYTRTLANEATGLSSPTELQELRDNLHIWVLENVERIDHLYRQSNVQPLSPQDALIAPLRVLAGLLGHSFLSAQLQGAIALQEQEPAPAMSSVQLLRAAVRSLIRQGYREKLTLKQLMLEMRLLGGDDASDTPSAKTSEWQEPRWVGRTLRAEKLVDLNARDERLRLWGEQTRVITLGSGFVTAVLEEFDSQDVAYAPFSRQPLEFCLSRLCGECPYAGFCSMRPRKEKQ